MDSISIKQIGKYQYDESKCLGEGSYAKVYEGLIIQNNQQVAIKKLDLAIFSKDQYLQKQIISEIEILKKLNHENIVKFIDILCSKNSLYIITELCIDGDLKQLLTKKNLSEKQVISIMIQIVNGFKEMVANGIIHRDLKPANILKHEGVVKITDFGFAKYVENYNNQLLKSCVGSPLYMAPQILQKKEYHTKCDIWSLGIIFYEMIFGFPPWVGRNEDNLLFNIYNKGINYHKAELSDFTKQFLRLSLVIDEQNRMEWKDVFEMFDGLQGNQIYRSNNILIFQKIDQILDVSENSAIGEEESIQTTPIWIGSPELIQKINPEQRQQIIKQSIEWRELLSEAHFINVEIFYQLDIDINQIQFSCILSQWVLAQSELMIKNIQGQLANKDKLKKDILKQLNEENSYYIILYTDHKSIIQQRNLQNIFDEDILQIYEEDHPTQEQLQLIYEKLKQICEQLNDQSINNIIDQITKLFYNNL